MNHCIDAFESAGEAVAIAHVTEKKRSWGASPDKVAAIPIVSAHHDCKQPIGVQKGSALELQL